MFGIQALILGAASSSAERTAPVTPRTIAITNGRMKSRREGNTSRIGKERVVAQIMAAYQNRI